MTGVVCQASDRSAQAMVASPSEGDCSALAGLVGNGNDAGFGTQLFSVGKAFGHIAQLGQDLGGADASGARQGHHRGGPRQIGHDLGDVRVQGLDLSGKRLEQGHQGEGGNGVGLGELGLTGAWRASVQAGQQDLSGAPSAIAVALAEGGDLPGRELSRQGPLLDEGQGDGRIHSGKDASGARPVGIQQGRQLVGQAHASGYQVIAGAHQGAQRTDRRGLWLQGAPAVAIGSQQVRQHERIARIALGVAGAVARPAGLHRIGVDGKHLVARFEQDIHYNSRGPLDGHRQRCAQGGQRVQQLGQSLAIMADGQTLEHAALSVDDAYGVGAVSPVQPDKDRTTHGQPPAVWVKTVRVGRRGGKLIDWRSGWLSVALHPVARCGLPAPRVLQVSCGLSSSKPLRQSPRGHGSRTATSALGQSSVKQEVAQ